MAHSEHIVIIGCRSIIAFFFHMEYYHLFHMEYHFFISNQHSGQEFGEVKKLAQRDSNPGPSRRQCVRSLYCCVVYNCCHFYYYIIRSVLLLSFLLFFNWLSQKP